MEDLYEKLNQALLTVKKEDVADAIFNLTDVKDALKTKELNRKLDEDSDTTVGELLDDVLLFLNTLEDSFKE
jgi:hypothetical protein